MNDTSLKGNQRFYVLAVFAYVGASFFVQAVSHFGMNAAHYDAIPFMREDQIMELGVFTMLLQGVVLAYLFPRFYRSGSPVVQGLKYGLIMGVFLGSYIALVEPAKYAAPSVFDWIAIEGMASLLQFTLFGTLIGLIYAKTRTPRVSNP